MTISRGIDRPDVPGMRLGNMLILSLAIHVLILTGGAFLKVSSTPRMTFGPVYSVQLVNLPASGLSSSPVSTLNKEILQTESKDRSVILRKQIDDRIKIPIKRLESTADRRSQIDKALERIRKKTAAESAATPSAAQSPSGGQTSTAGNSRFNDYYRTIWSRIKNQWAFPGGILPKGGLEAVVHARIMRDGSLLDIGLEKRSGNAYFDNSALRAVRKANPLPPLPEWCRDNSLDVGIRFHSSELQ